MKQSETAKAVRSSAVLGGYLAPDTVVKKGDTITIPKGTPYRCMGGEANRIALKTYEVTMPHNCREYTDEVCWAGPGGYWCYAKKKDVRASWMPPNDGTKRRTATEDASRECGTESANGRPLQ